MSTACVRLGDVAYEFWRSMADCDIGVLQLCWCPDEIEDIDLVSFGWDLKFGLTYGIQTRTERRLDHNLGFGRS
jgi:hypothetical protein